LRSRDGQGGAARRAGARSRGSRARAGRARADVRAAAHKPADRVVRDHDGAVTEPRPRIAIVVFPGSNDDWDAALAFEALGAEPALVWHGELELPRDVAAVALPGGFSYGDYLRCGAIARFPPVMASITRFAADGRLLLGI